MELLLYSYNGRIAGTTPASPTTIGYNTVKFHSPERRKVDLAGSSSVEPESIDPILGIAYGIVGPVIVTFGLIGNLLILVVVGKSSMKGAMAVYLSTLAISDIGALLSFIPLLVRLTKGQACSYTTAFFYAHFELFVLTTFMSTSIFNVLAMTVDRYTSVCWAGRCQAMHTPQRARMAAVLSFIVALLISTPLSVMKLVTTSSSTAAANGTCPYEFAENRDVTGHKLWTSYVWFAESCVRFVPALILATLNSLIIIKFRVVVQNRLRMALTSYDPPGSTSKSPLNKVSSHTVARHLEQERKMVTLLTSIIILFFATNIPSAVLSIIYSEAYDHDYRFQMFRACANLLEMSNFALNFIIYCFFSKEFRKMLREVFPCCVLKPRRRNTSSFSNTPNTHVTSAANDLS